MKEPKPKPELVLNSRETELVNRNQYANGGWLHSPANLALFSRSISYLKQLNKARQIDSNWVPYVRAAREKDATIVYIWPTDEKDPDKIEVKKRGSQARINIRSLLEPTHHTVDLGYRVRYEIVPAGEDSPVGPALMFDLAHPLERRQQPPSVLKRKRSAKKANASAGQLSGEQ